MCEKKSYKVKKNKNIKSIASQFKNNKKLHHILEERLPHRRSGTKTDRLRCAYGVRIVQLTLLIATEDFFKRMYVLSKNCACGWLRLESVKYIYDVWTIHTRYCLLMVM